MVSEMTNTVVKAGMFVELELIDQDGNIERMAVNIVEDKAADFRAGFLGLGTPLASVILGQPAGKTLAYRVGDLRAVRILSIQASTAHPQSDAASRREDVIKKAVAESDKTNAVIFAASFSGKWGDYDPEGVEKWDAQQVDDPDREEDDNKV